MTALQRWAYNIAISSLFVFGTFGAVSFVTRIFGDYCWAPRFGGLLVGCSVFVQGYVYANQDDYQDVTWTGLTKEQHVMHLVYFATTFGTLLWAFGDFIHSLFGVKICQPT